MLVMLHGSSAAAASGAPNLLQASLAQTGRRLVFTLDTASPVPLSQLERLPSPRSAAARYLCLSLEREGRSAERRLCLGGEPGARRRLGLELVAGGRAVRKATVAAQVKRPGPTRLTVALVPAAAGLAPGRYGWRVLQDNGECAASLPRECEQSLPAEGAFRFRLRPVRPVGCSGGTTRLVYDGPRNRKVVALSFDDGPSSYTPGFLAVLRRERVHATFFEVGQEIAGRTATLRRILREGSEIGNHTMHHDPYPGFADLAATDALIRAATHFEPCLFRPPDGAVDSAVVAAAGAAGLETVVWDVDPTDWANPGSGAIYSRVVGAVQPGSIVLMHDGGGNRAGTLAALPTIIETLRARGYRFATVSQLLGQRTIYSPYG